MSNLYDDAIVSAAAEAVREHGEWSEKWAPDAPLCIATDVLPIVAPLIAAKALRDAALDIGRNRRQGKPPLGQVPFSVLVSPVFLERRAAEIERGE
jgi:hypothetical protein